MRTRTIRSSLGAIAAAALLWPGAANAAWVKAETERFVVYGQGKEDKVRDLAMRLSVYDAVLRLVNPGTPTTQARKLEVYLVRGTPEIRRVSPKMANNVGGFYTAREGGVFALADDSQPPLARDDLLFHEYAHAFMLENFPAAYPGWFVEGWAEYFSTVDVSPKRAELGRYNPGNLYTLFAANWLPWETVVTKATWEVPKQDSNVYYAQSWLLMHYMRSDPERSAQLTKATRAIAAGEHPVRALEQATGRPLADIGRSVRLYKKLPMFAISNPLPNPPEIVVSKLPPSADDFLLYDLRMTGTIPDPSDAEALADIRKRAAQWSGDRMAELSLARAEFTYGDVSAGEAIVARRLQQDPKDVEALLVAGQGQLRAGDRDGAQREARYKAARPYLVKAYDLNNDDYRILLAYAVSRTVDPTYPNANDVNALLTVRAMAPTVDLASLMAGGALLAVDRKADAMAVLSIVANNPHGGGAARMAQALMKGEPTSDLAAAAQQLDPQR
ncbi:DUF1570 domain-containing protein [Phenylobacterium sp. LjRoot164]|uniref:hypothetical protein n=1 Tax=unclassified Phenylobacterium TaxID=2640670 RepID=UPI003ECF4F05